MSQAVYDVTSPNGVTYNAVAECDIALVNVNDINNMPIGNYADIIAMSIVDGEIWLAA